MMELNMKKLLEFLQKIAPGEITEKSLCYLLHIKSHTAKRLLSGEIRRPDESAWYKNACRMKEQVDNDYEEERQTVLKGRNKEDLTEREREQLLNVEKRFGMNLAEKYKKVGIYRLQECCYFPGRPIKRIFDKQLTALVEEVLIITEEFQGIEGKECFLNFLHQNNSSPSEIEDMKNSTYHDMAEFLVTQVTQNQNKTDKKEQTTAKKAEGAEFSGYLSDQHGEHVGTWSFLIFTEEQEKTFRNGSLVGEEFSELIFLPGDYILYVSNIIGSVSNGLAKPQNFQELVDAMFRKLRRFAKRGMYFKQLYINICDPVYELLYRDMGFNFKVENFLSGHIYIQSLSPFPSSLQTHEPTLLSELKVMYDEHFSG